MTGVIEAHDMKNLFRKVNLEDANLWDWTRLPGVHGGPHDRHHAGASQPF